MVKIRGFGQSLIMILFAGALVSCSNAIPTVVSLTTQSPPKNVEAQDPRNFAQINAGSAKESLTAGYKGNVRISQSLGNIKATSASGHKLQGTVTLQK